jgi:hypothetical protein
MSLAQLAAGLTALWADRAQRDAAGYVTTDVHLFSTEGSALVTEPIELGSPGVEWLYSPLLLDEVRIRATSVEAESALFVGIGPSTDVYGYLAGVGHTLISEFWGDRVQIVDGDTLGSAPEAQDFWVASAIGSGAQTVTWEPANGSWAVVVMNADGRPGVDVATDLGAVMPSLPWITIGLLAVGTVFLVGGTLLIAGMIRRQARAKVQ